MFLGIIIITQGTLDTPVHVCFLFLLQCTEVLELYKFPVTEMLHFNLFSRETKASFHFLRTGFLFNFNCSSIFLLFFSSLKQDNQCEYSMLAEDTSLISIELSFCLFSAPFLI